jgi:hypothetical protein
MKKTILLVAVLAFVIAAPRTFAGDSDPKAHDMSAEATIVPDADPIAQEWFGPDARYEDHPYDPQQQLDVYGKKHMNKTAQMPVELGIRLYDRGAYTPRPTYFGSKDPVGFSFMSYGDFRVAAASYDRGVPASNGKSQQSALAIRLNLDMDLALTPTERLHAFVRPLDKNGSFTSYQISGGVNDKFVHRFDFNLDTLFFEGDAGAIAQGWTNRRNSIDLPFTVGRVPIVTQNGIWIEDAIDGGAVGITAKNSARFDVSNTDLTFFAGFRNVNTAAVPRKDAAKVFGLAGFADARKGYLEYGYGFTAADNHDLSYHNLTAAFSRRYKGRVANSVRVIGNFGQKGSAGVKTADGVLLLVENSFIPRYIPWGNPLNLVPYVNLFAGFRSPQSLARTADSGGVLRNTGINFESDGLTNYPTLDPRAKDSYGGAAGIEYLFDLQRQIVFEGAVVQRRSGTTLGDQYAIGARYQHKLNNAWIVRADAMKGWIQGQKDIYGVRLELRRKF